MHEVPKLNQSIFKNIIGTCIMIPKKIKIKTITFNLLSKDLTYKGIMNVMRKNAITKCIQSSNQVIIIQNDELNTLHSKQVIKIGNL